MKKVLKIALAGVGAIVLALAIPSAVAVVFGWSLYQNDCVVLIGTFLAVPLIAGVCAYASEGGFDK